MPEYETWINWTHGLLEKLKKYKQLNHRLAIDNGLLRAENNQLKSSPSRCISCLAKRTSTTNPNSNSNSIFTRAPARFTSTSTLQLPAPPAPSIAPLPLSYSRHYPASNQLSTLYDDDEPIVINSKRHSILYELVNNDERIPTTQPMEPTTAATTMNNNTCKLFSAQVDEEEEEEEEVMTSTPMDTAGSSSDPPPPRSPLPAKRTRPSVNYVLPSLKKKLRRGDRFACNIYNNYDAIYPDTTTTARAKRTRRSATTTSNAIPQHGVSQHSSSSSSTNNNNHMDISSSRNRNKNDDDPAAKRAQPMTSYTLPSLKNIRYPSIDDLLLANTLNDAQQVTAAAPLSNSSGNIGSNET